MRKIFILGLMVISLSVAARHFQWPRADPVTYLKQASHLVRSSGAPNGALTPEQTAQAVGQHAVVCGTPAKIYFARRSRGEPTFINFGAAYPNETFTVVIFGEHRAAFRPPPESWMGHTICVSGQIRSYRGSPEIIAKGTNQIRLDPGNG